jgi:hypothetical protein
MVEELLIKITSKMDNNGFVQASTAMGGLSKESQSLNAINATGARYWESNGKAMTYARKEMTDFNIASNAATKQITGGLTPAMMGMDTSKLQQMGVDMETTSTKTSKLRGVMDQLGISTKQLGMGMVVTGGAIIAAYAMIAYMAIQAASASEQNWGRLTVALGKTGMEMDSVKADYKDMVDSIVSNTGRSRGEIISAIGNLARVGVVNKEIASTSVKAMGALAMLKYPGDPAGFNTIAEGWTNLINKPTIMGKSLTTLGIDTKKFNQVLQENGLTMKDWTNLTTDQRTALLNQTVALQGGAAANEVYRHSYQGIMAQLTDLWSQFITSVGYEMLPILKEFASWALPILTGLLKGFQALPGPVKTLLLVLPLVLGVLLLIGGAALLLAQLWPAIIAIGAAAGIAEIPAAALLGTLGLIAGLGLITVYVALDVAQALHKVDEIKKIPGGDSPLIQAEGFTTSFASHLPLPYLMSKLTGNQDPTNNPQKYVNDQQGQNSGIKGALGNIGGAVSSPFTKMSADAKKVGTEWNREMALIKGGWNNTGSFLKSAWTNTISTITLIGQRIYTRMLLPTLAYMEGAWNNTAAFFQGVWNNTVAYIGGAWANTVAYIMGAWNNTIAFIVGGAQQIYAAGANAFWGIYNAVVAALAAAWAYVQSIIKAVVDAWNQLSGAVQALFGGGAAGDPHTANNLTGGASGSAHIATNLTNSSSSTNVTHNHTWNIGSVDSKETADYLVDQVIQRFTKENNIRGN